MLLYANSGLLTDSSTACGVTGAVGYERRRDAGQIHTFKLVRECCFQAMSSLGSAYRIEERVEKVDYYSRVVERVELRGSESWSACVGS
jgi:hypothetical protein